MSKLRETYAVRPFEPGDREAFLSLYETVFGVRPGEEWFAWKYADNPHVDHVPIVVAVDEDDGLVGARPLFALPMAAGRERFTALQPGDTMVHPDHRRQGLFTRMTERSIERYEDRDGEALFNFPNDQSRPGYLKLGWEEVGEVTTYYRVQSPSAWLDPDSGAERAAGALADLAGAGYYRAKDALASVPEDVRVERRESIPAALLAELYRRGIPRGYHAVRDEQFCEWRYRNPRWSYRTYVAREGGEPIAAAVVSERAVEGSRTARIVDALPLDADAGALSALCAAIVEDYADADGIAAPAVLPSRVLARFGFRADTSLPLSLASSPSTLVARSIDGGDAVAGRSLTDLSNWPLTFVERDTS